MDNLQVICCHHVCMRWDGTMDAAQRCTHSPITGIMMSRKRLRWMHFIDISMETRSYLQAWVVMSHAKMLDTLIVVDVILTSYLARKSRLILTCMIKCATLLLINHIIVFSIYVVSTLSNLHASIRSSVYRWKASLLVPGRHSSLPSLIGALGNKEFIAHEVYVIF